MARSEILGILQSIENLGLEIENFVPQTTSTIGFRADLAGLLVVSIAASYETCVKETINNYAARHHVAFSNYTQNQYSRINSRISLNDLYLYTKTFDNSVHQKFSQLIVSRKSRMNRLFGKDPTQSYKQLLSWRHDFAHAGIRNTTVEEAIATHRIAKYVLYSFNEAFD